MPARLGPSAALLVLLTACGQATSSAPQTSAPASPSRAAESHSASHAPASAPASAQAGGTITEGPVAPGEYTSSTTGATISFTIADTGWDGAEDLEGVGFALLSQEYGALASVSVVAFPGEVFTDPCDPAAPTETIDTTSEAFMAWLAGVEGVDAEEARETTVGDKPALMIDLTTAVPDACTEPPWIFLWALPTVGDFHFADEETVRVWAVDGSEAMVAIVAEATSGADTAAFLSAVDEIVATMTVD